MTNTFEANDSLKLCTGGFLPWFSPCVPWDKCTLLAKSKVCDHENPDEAMRKLELEIYRTPHGGHFAFTDYITYWNFEKSVRKATGQFEQWCTVCGLPENDADAPGLPLKDLFACLQGEQALNVSCFCGHPRLKYDRIFVRQILPMELAKINAMWGKAVDEVTAALRDQI